MPKRRRWSTLVAILGVGASVSAATAQAQSVVPILNDLVREAPECVAFAPGRLDCLARTRAGQMAWVFWQDGRWSVPVNLGGMLNGPPSCVVRGPQGLNCFAVQRDSSMGAIALNGGRWGPWRTHAASLAPGRLDCLAPQRDRISCFARTRANRLALKAWLGDDLWQPWRDLGGDMSSDPQCMTLGLDRVACLWRRQDGRLQAWMPAERGPDSAILTFPAAAGAQLSGQPACAQAGPSRAVCLFKTANDNLSQWQGWPILGRATADAIKSLGDLVRADPICTAAQGRVICTTLSQTDGAARREWRDGTWTTTASFGDRRTAAAKCVALDAARTMCLTVDARGEMRAENYGDAPLALQTAAAQAVAPPPPLPTMKPPDVAAAPTRPTPPPAPIATVSVAEPLGLWHVFEPRSGLECQITLFDAPGSPYRRLTRNQDCDALPSMEDVSRWNQQDDAIVLRNRRGQVYFRFKEAGPTALRAKWRRDDMVLLARDPRAFQGAPPKIEQDDKPTAPAKPTDVADKGGFAGVWRLRGPGDRLCTVRLLIDPDSASTVAQAQDCRGAAARIDGWYVSNGAIVLSAQGDTIARFLPGPGRAWRGRLTGGRREMLLTKQ